jgi:hypothetical protein
LFFKTFEEDQMIYRVLAILLLVIFLCACIPDSPPPDSDDWVWQATYCKEEGCPEGGTEVSRSEILKEGAELGCPTSITVAEGFGRIIDWVNYTIKSGTCEVYRYDLYVTPSVATPDQIFDYPESRITRMP